MTGVVAVIPARGGSKGVPRKNLRDVGGVPLIAHTIAVARAAEGLFRQVVISTDDPEVADVARRHGLDVPFMRPPALGADSTPMVPVVQHAVRWAEDDAGEPCSWVCLLQPTEPLRSVEDIAGALAIANEGDCDSVISVVQVFATHPILMKRIEDGRLVPYCIPEREGTRRQDYDPPAYMRNGSIYLTRRDVVMERASLWGDTIRPYVMPADRSISIDDERDLLLADIMVRRRREGA